MNSIQITDMISLTIPIRYLNGSIIQEPFTVIITFEEELSTLFYWQIGCVLSVARWQALENLF